MLISSWNVNSVRARIENIKEYLKKFSPDIMMMQEIKTPDDTYPYEDIKTLKYDYDCIIKKSDIKINIKIPQLNRIVFALPSKDSPNLSMINFYDRENELNNFINAFVIFKKFCYR